MRPDGIAEKIAAFAVKNRYILLILAAGVVLLSLPTQGGKGGEAPQTAQEEYAFSVEEYEEKLSALLGRIDGAGEVTVLLAVGSTGERVIASDTKRNETESETDGRRQTQTEEETQAVKVSGGSGANDAVTLRYVYPEFTGAVVLAEGASSSRVRLDIMEAVEAATGLSADRIKVLKSK